MRLENGTVHRLPSVLDSNEVDFQLGGYPEPCRLHADHQRCRVEMEVAVVGGQTFDEVQLLSLLNCGVLYLGSCLRRCQSQHETGPRIVCVDLGRLDSRHSLATVRGDNFNALS